MLVGSLRCRLAAGDVLAFVLAECPHRRPGSAKLLVTALRSLLGYLHVEGVIARPLAPVVPSVAGWRLAGLPQGLEAEQVTALLDGCDRETAVGVRDLAILKLLVRLGLRRGEVAVLALDDIDWRSRRDRRARQGQSLRAVAAARRRRRRARRLSTPARPASAEGRTVFMRVKAPHRALTPAGVSQVVIAAGERAGLGRVNAHRLRHTPRPRCCAAGAPLAEIGQVLRHRSQQTTAIYAKVDRERLRALARPWPSAGARHEPARDQLARLPAVRRALGYKLARTEKLLAPVHRVPRGARRARDHD